MTYPIVREGVAAGRLNVHGWLYDMEHGALSAYDPQAGELARPARHGVTASAASPDGLRRALE